MKKNLQNYEKKNKKIDEDFQKLAEENPESLENELKFSWSIWGFGQESLETSAQRLKDAGIDYIELPGNIYGEDLGYDASEVREIMDEKNMEVSGLCGMYSPDRDLSNNEGWKRQEAIDYIRKNVEFGEEIGADYFLIVPGAVGRTEPLDDYEMDRSVESLKRVADVFEGKDIKGAIEPVRADEVSFCNTFEEADEYIERVDHPDIQWINGDVYHMIQGETHIGKTIREYKNRLINLHLADSNRKTLGTAMMDFDTIIKALYLIGFQEGEKYVTAEPLGPTNNPYPAIHAKHDTNELDKMVNDSYDYFRKREKIVKEQALE